MRVRSLGRLTVVSALFLAALSCKQGIGNNDYSGGSEVMTAEGTRLRDDPTYGEWGYMKKSQETLDQLEDSHLLLTGGGDDFEIVEGDIAVSKKQKLNLGSAENNLWPNATVIYSFDPAFPDRQEVLRAMQVWTQETGVKFRERTNEQAYALIVRKEDGCWSNIGYTGQKQVINLGASCVLFGTKLHELGHTLGLNHEQSRKDRDANIRIDINAIDPANLQNFDKGSTDVGPYDFDSVMHYGKYAFSVYGAQTIFPNGNRRIGQREGLSQFDVQAVSQLYRTSGTGGSGAVVGAGQGVDITDPDAKTNPTDIRNRNTLASVAAAPPLPAATTSISTGCAGFGGYDWTEKYAKDSSGNCRDAAKYCTCWRTTANTCGLYLPNGTLNVAGANFTGSETNCKDSCGQVATNGATYMRNNCNQQLVVINSEGLLEIFRYSANGQDAIPESDNL